MQALWKKKQKKNAVIWRNPNNIASKVKQYKSLWVNNVSGLSIHNMKS